MKKEHEESSKLVLGLLIGGVVGAGALYYLHTAQDRNTPALKKIGKTITGVGEMLENCDLGSANEVLESIEKTIPAKTEIVSHITDWIDAGLTLWKNFKKG